MMFSFYLIFIIMRYMFDNHVKQKGQDVNDMLHSVS